MRILQTITFAGLAIQASSLLAATAYRTTPVDEIQGESATRVGYENIVYIQQTGAWLGTQGCSTSHSYFNAKDNPHFVAIILSARVSERPLKVYVDDALPKLSGFCQVINISL